MLCVPVASPLDQSLEVFLKEKEDPRKCPNCNQSIIENRHLTKHPSVLVIQIKRSVIGNGSSWKNTGLLNFGLNNVDFGKYFAKSDGAKEHESKQYNLFAVCNHYGESGGGHNTATASHHRKGSS